MACFLLLRAGMTIRTTLAPSFAALGACAAPRPTASRCRHAAPPDVRFERSPGGVPEVDARWLHDNHCHVRVVDLRQDRELEARRLAFAEHVPLSRLGGAAEAWDPNEPVVLVCRSGRRSARGTRLLEDMGFSRVASMTGGLMVWDSLDLPLVTGPEPRSAKERPAPTDPDDSLDRDEIEAHLGDPEQIRWVKAASLVMQGTQSCVDGRDPRPVVGTSGGDAGELLLALVALERVRGGPLSEEEVRHALDAHLDAFGRFYLHTDAHALEALVGSDPRFEGHDPRELVRHPPQPLEAPLLEALTEPDHVGCGHLRLILTHPDEYGVRPELTASLLRATFRRLWQGAAIDLVVLEGEHEESGVVTVHLDHDVHSYTRVPTVAPRIGDHEVFVSHPQVSAWLRAQQVEFLFEEDAWLRGHPERREELLETLEELGDAQLHATLRHLASRLPVYDAYVSRDAVRVEGPRQPGAQR